MPIRRATPDAPNAISGDMEQDEPDAGAAQVRFTVRISAEAAERIDELPERISKYLRSPVNRRYTDTRTARSLKLTPEQHAQVRTLAAAANTSISRFLDRLLTDDRLVPDTPDDEIYRRLKRKLYDPSNPFNDPYPYADPDPDRNMDQVFGPSPVVTDPVRLDPVSPGWQNWSPSDPTTSPASRVGTHIFRQANPLMGFWQRQRQFQFPDSRLDEIYLHWPAKTQHRVLPYDDDRLKAPPPFPFGIGDLVVAPTGSGWGTKSYYFRVCTPFGWVDLPKEFGPGARLVSLPDPKTNYLSVKKSIVVRFMKNLVSGAWEYPAIVDDVPAVAEPLDLDKLGGYTMAPAANVPTIPATSAQIARR